MRQDDLVIEALQFLACALSIQDIRFALDPLQEGRHVRVQVLLDRPQGESKLELTVGQITLVLQDLNLSGAVMRTVFDTCLNPGGHGSLIIDSRRFNLRGMFCLRLLTVKGL